MAQASSRRLWWQRAAAAGALSVAFVASLVVVATPAAAAGNVYTTTTIVNVRTGPGTLFPSQGTEASGASFTLSCQMQGGTSVFGNQTWDRVTFADGRQGLITDYYTTTPSFNSFAPNMSQCAPLTRENHAITWAKGQVTSHTTGWYNACDYFVAVAYGMSLSGYYTAYDHFIAETNQGNINPPSSPYAAPAGALVFFGLSTPGHVMIAEGNGKFLSAGKQDYPEEYTSLSQGGANYRGWAYANGTVYWPGR